MFYKVGVTQTKPGLFHVEKNIRSMISNIKESNCDLLVFPELATSGYVFNSIDEVARVAENVKTSDNLVLLKQASKDNNVSVVFGFPEESNGKFYNSCLLYNPDGSSALYRKTHLFYEEKTFFSPGDTGFVIAKAKAGVPIGLMICFDWFFPEAARTLALKGAQILCHCSNLVMPWCQQAMITRSLENHVYSITSNRVGTEINGDKSLTFTGMSQILSTKGDILTRLSMDKEDFSSISIEPQDACNKQINLYNNLFGDRRPDLYQ